MLERPEFPFMVGRLVGAAEMAATQLQAGKLSADELQDVGDRLGQVAAWFVTPERVIQLPPPVGPDTSART